jgi:hypothetical protein
MRMSLADLGLRITPRGPLTPAHLPVPLPFPLHGAVLAPLLASTGPADAAFPVK